MRMRNMHRARLHVRIKKHKRGHLLSVSLIDKFSLMPRTIEQHLENLDQIRSQPNHNISVRGSMARANILQREVTLCKKKVFARRRIFYILSVLWERGRWRCPGSTSTSSTSSSAATLWGSFQTPGRLSTGEITVSSPKNCELLPQKLWGSRWKSSTPWAKSFLSLLIKKNCESLAAKVHWLMIDSELVICCSPHHAEYRESLMILMKDA